MTDKLTVPMTPEMFSSVFAAADRLKVPAAEWVRRLITAGSIVENGGAQQEPEPEAEEGEAA
jgi:hypothetical protein